MLRSLLHRPETALRAKLKQNKLRTGEAATSLKTQPQPAAKKSTRHIKVTL